MSEENLSIKFTEETKKTIYKNQNSFTSEKYFLAAIAVNAVIYIITFFSPKQFVADGEMSVYVLYLLGLIGFAIGHEAIKLSKKISSKRALKDESNIEPTIMGGYEYISYQDQKWVKWLVSVASGGFNVLLYLLFLKFI